MHWSDRALVLGARAYGESAVVLELMTRERGRHLGLAHGGSSRRLRPVLQPGNTVHATWRARLDEQLGTYTVEADRSRAARLMGSALALHGLATLVAHLRLLPERDPHAGMFDLAEAVVDRLDDEAEAGALMARLELALLAELGFGLDLYACAATGSPEDLAFVSPRTGRAVSRAAGEPFRERLFVLPAFLSGDGGEGRPDRDELAAAFRLTGHFLDVRVYEPRGLQGPPQRERFLAVLERRPAGTRPDKEAERPGDSAAKVSS